MSSEQFHAIASELLDRVEFAVTKLKDCNRGLEIKRYPAGTYHGGDDDDDDDDGTTIKHGGRLSIRVLPMGDLYWGGGTYFLTIIPDAHDDGVGNASGGGVVTLLSPLSGSFMYAYNPSTKEWVGSEDGHSLLGMLTRDWIRQCNGVPDL
jgi:frataxin-like iron-binding protein CyaY